MGAMDMLWKLQRTALLVVLAIFRYCNIYWTIRISYHEYFSTFIYSLLFCCL